MSVKMFSDQEFKEEIREGHDLDNSLDAFERKYAYRPAPDEYCGGISLRQDARPVPRQQPVGSDSLVRPEGP